MQTTIYTSLASTYGAGKYENANYNGTNATSGASGNTDTSSLTNTGIAVAFIVAIAAVILLVAMIVRIWKRPSKNS